MAVEAAVQLQRRLNRIEAVIAKLTPAVEATQLPLYRDAADSQFVAEGRLVAVPPTALNDRERMR